MKKRIALIFGGEGCEREISKKSAARIYSYIKDGEYALDLIYIDEDGRFHLLYDNQSLEDGSFVIEKEKLSSIIFTHGGFLHSGVYLPLDLAIPILHGDFGEDGKIQGLLSSFHIPFIGQDVYASAICQDKAYTKAVARLLSIPTASWITLTETDPLQALKRVEDVLKFPLFIKPARLGSSIGASPAHSKKEFFSQYEKAREISERVLVEEKLDVACELECAFLSIGEREDYRVGCVETDGCFYDYHKKYSVPHQNTLPLYDDKKITSLVIKYSEALRGYIGIKEISRFDFLLTKSKKLYFNEINTLPGMTKSSLYPRLTQAMGYGEGEFIRLLISSHIE